MLYSTLFTVFLFLLPNTLYNSYMLIVCIPQDSYVEILSPNVMVLRGRLWEGILS